MKRLTIAVLMLAALSSFAFTAAAQEALTAGTVTGNLSAGERVSYTLDATEGEYYLIAVNSKEFDTYVDVIRPSSMTEISDDDGGAGTNSLASFLASSTGTFTVEVSSYSSSASGEFTISVSIGASALEIDSPVQTTVANGDTSIYRFQVAEAGAYNISALGDEELNIHLSLANFMGIIIDEVEGGYGVDAIFQRIVLDAGIYHLIINPGNAEASGEVTVTVETTEAKTLGVEPTNFLFNEASRDDVASFEVEAGKVYLITVQSVTGAAGDFNMHITPASDSVFSFANFGFSSGIGGTFFYVPDVTGKLDAAISGGFYSADEADEFTVTLVEQAE